MILSLRLFHSGLSFSDLRHHRGDVQAFAVLKLVDEHGLGRYVAVCVADCAGQARKISNLRKRVADIDVVVATHTIDYDGAVCFKIVSDADWYTFLYEKDGAFVELGKGKTTMLATEVTHPMTFTGTFFGVFTEQGDITVTNVTAKELK